MMRGNIGQPHGGWPEAIQKKVLKGEKPLTERPGKLLPPVDLEATRAKVSAELEGKTIDDEDLNGYLMYPKVFLDYMGRHRTYGPVRTLPTPTFFYGMQPQRGDLGRDRSGQDAGDPAAGGGRDPRGRRRAGVLRAERPAAGDPGAEPRRKGPRRGPAQGGRGQPRPCRRADAGGGRRDRGDGGAEGAGGRSAC